MPTHYAHIVPIMPAPCESPPVRLCRTRRPDVLRPENNRLVPPRGYVYGQGFEGQTPTELPIEQPMKFEFVVNLKAAKAIGLTIPPNVLVRADRVIR